MSTVHEIIARIEKIANDTSLTTEQIGFGLIENIMRDDDYNELIKQYRELETLAERGSDLEYEKEGVAELGVGEIKALLHELKTKVDNERNRS
jgi:hypothetical protein